MDLSKSAAIEYAAIEYNEKNIWNDVYKEGALIQSQEFTFSHVSSSAFYYNGFFASKSTAVLESSNFDDQWGCMAKGGYAGEGTPYLVAYWDAYADSISGERSCEVTLSSPYYAAGFYVCNNPFTYYTIQKGNRLVEKFETGDWFKLIVHGVDAQGTEIGKLEYYLADYRGKDSNTWTLNKSWEWVDLSSLGRVASIYFTMESSRPGERGPQDPDLLLPRPSYGSDCALVGRRGCGSCRQSLLRPCCRCGTRGFGRADRRSPLSREWCLGKEAIGTRKCRSRYDLLSFGYLCDILWQVQSEDCKMTIKKSV